MAKSSGVKKAGDYTKPMTTLYLTEPGTIVQCQNEILQIRRQQDKTAVRLAEVDLVVVLSGVQLTSGAIAKFLDRGIETLFLSRSGRFRGRLQGQFPTNPQIRIAQYQVIDSYFGLALAQKFILGKIQNQRVLLQRYHRKHKGQITPIAEAIDLIAAHVIELKRLESPTRDQLMGFEGICGRHYFQGLRLMFPPVWQFQKRDRRPPPDPINALLSWGYGVLLSRIFAVAVQAGLDPYLGFFHAIQPYRPNLVLDLMEEFRPVVVDRLVIRLLEAQRLTPEDFIPSDDGTGIWLGSLAKKVFLELLEKEFQQAIAYPPQNRRLKLSQILLEQSRSLARCLVERSLNYEPYTIR